MKLELGPIAPATHDLERAVASLEQALSTLASGDDRWRKRDCLSPLAVVAFERGQPDDAARRARDLAAAADKMGSGSVDAAVATASLAIADATRGVPGADAVVERALGALREADTMMMLRWCLTWLAELDLASGRPMPPSRVWPMTVAL